MIKETVFGSKYVSVPASNIAADTNLAERLFI
jgi:hypothetical protein